MKRGKRSFENDNTYIYVGTAIFILFAIALAIIMYMTTKAGVRIQNAEQFAEENVQEDIETVISDIGKKVEEKDELPEADKVSQNIITNETDETLSSNSIESGINKTSVNSKEKEIITQTNQQVDKPVEEKKEITFKMPIEGEIICEFAKENLIYSETLKEWITHTGIDIKADKTSIIKSAADGVVKSIINDPRYGLTVVITHDQGYETIYSNLLTAEFIVEGEEVFQGQTIGTAGNTAAFESNMECHIHFELLKDGEYLNPKIYLK